ncbi:hypothetical protein BH10PSE9_BH10PSE9_07780 [soil metagenome]
MPLRHRDDAFIPEATGVTFVMSDAGVRDVVCLVRTEALRAAARECGLSDKDDGGVFCQLRRAIEECASDIYDLREHKGADVIVVHAAQLLA